MEYLRPKTSPERITWKDRLWNIGFCVFVFAVFLWFYGVI